METKVMHYPVVEVMQPAPITVRPETPIGELLALFAQHDFNAFPVTDKRGVLQGMVSKLDVLRIFHSPEREPWTNLRPRTAERVRDFMTRGFITVEVDDNVSTAIDLMVDYRLRTLPVIERRQLERFLVGVVTRTDVMRCLEVA